MALSGVERKLKALTASIEYFCTLLFIMMTTITFFQVVGRYVFGKSCFWAEELARFSMVWIAFLGAAIGVSLKAHTRIDFFINLLSARPRQWVELFDSFACLAFILLVTYSSIDIVKISMRNITTGLRVPLGYVYLALPVSGVLMTVYFLIQIYFMLKNISAKEVGIND